MGKKVENCDEKNYKNLKLAFLILAKNYPREETMATDAELGDSKYCRGRLL